MRSRKIYFEAKQMKPNTKVYAFFDDVAVTSYVKQESFQEWSNTSDQSEVYNGVTSHPAASSGSLTTDANGQVAGSFIIPRNASLKFKTGQKYSRCDIFFHRHTFQGARCSILLLPGGICLSHTI